MEKNVDTVPPVGTEISFILDGEARRGWVVASEPVEIGCYPKEGDQSLTLSWPLEKAEVLSEQEPPPGWEAVSLQDDQNNPWIDLRLTKEFMDQMRLDAQKRGIELYEMFALYLKEGLEQLSQTNRS